MMSSINQELYFKILPSMSEKEKKLQRINELLNVETKPTFSCLLYEKTSFFYT